jgi:hypothetical protein
MRERCNNHETTHTLWSHTFIWQQDHGSMQPQLRKKAGIVQRITAHNAPGGCMKAYKHCRGCGVCTGLGRTGKPNKKCSTCNCVYYCSKVCQETHWKQVHKFECIQMRDRGVPNWALNYMMERNSRRQLGRAPADSDSQRTQHYMDSDSQRTQHYMDSDSQRTQHYMDSDSQRTQH